MELYLSPVIAFFSYFSTLGRETFLGLESVHRQLLTVSAVAAGGILAYVLHKRRQVKSIPLGEGWWGTGEKPLSEDGQIYPFKVQTSDEEIKVIFSCSLNFSSQSTNFSAVRVPITRQ